MSVEWVIIVELIKLLSNCYFQLGYLNDQLFWEIAVHSFLHVSFVNVLQFLCLCFFPFGFEGEMRYLIVLIPDHCLFVLEALYEI